MEKGKTMTDREKLIALLCEAMLIYDRIKDDRQDNPFHVFADHLLTNGVTITPAVPGPSEADPNIMEMCFHNGERHMKEKIASVMMDRKKMFPCEADVIDCILNMLEGL
jgi:hypothetical protein